MVKKILEKLLSNGLGKLLFSEKKKESISPNEDRYKQALISFKETVLVNSHKYNVKDRSFIHNSYYDIRRDKTISSFEVKWTLFRNAIFEKGESKELLNHIKRIEKLLSIDIKDPE